jgi:hypothetical protein
MVARKHECQAPGGELSEGGKGVNLTDEQRLDWLCLIRSQNVGPRGIMAQPPEAQRLRRSYMAAKGKGG